MNQSHLYNIYFSATGTTRKCVEAVASILGVEPVSDINLADNLNAEMPNPGGEDIVTVAAPVYGGRLPKMVAESLCRLQGNGAKAIAMVVYGNRDYDDALLELIDILTQCGFNVIGAGAFIGQHSIFPTVGSERPDMNDKRELKAFGNACREAVMAGRQGGLNVKGKRPYKKIAGVPLHPQADRKVCRSCRKCADMCPAGAISPAEPYVTDNDKCISCGRCIAVCPHKARHYAGLKYSFVNRLFVWGFSRRKNPEWTVADR